MYVVIRDMSAGNEVTGEAWQETALFPGDTTLDEVMEWALASDMHSLGYSRKKVTITKPVIKTD